MLKLWDDAILLVIAMIVAHEAGHYFYSLYNKWAPTVKWETWHFVVYANIPDGVPDKQRRMFGQAGWIAESFFCWAVLILAISPFQGIRAEHILLVYSAYVLHFMFYPWMNRYEDTNDFNYLGTCYTEKADDLDADKEAESTEKSD